jgi:hypothetical protein
MQTLPFHCKVHYVSLKAAACLAVTVHRWQHKSYTATTFRAKSSDTYAQEHSLVTR